MKNVIISFLANFSSIEILVDVVAMDCYIPEPDSQLQVDDAQPP